MIDTKLDSVSFTSQGMHYIVFLKHLYSVVRSLLHRKKLPENFWSYFLEFLCLRSQDQTKLTLVYLVARFFLSFLCAEHYRILFLLT